MPKRRRFRAWTTSMDAQLRQLDAEGYSRSQIGRIMGLSKNAICGRCARLGMTKSGLVDDPQDRPKAPDPNIGSGCLYIAADPRNIRSAVRRGADPYCGAPRHGLSSYCAEHHRIVWVG